MNASGRGPIVTGRRSASGRQAVQTKIAGLQRGGEGNRRARGSKIVPYTPAYVRSTAVDDSIPATMPEEKVRNFGKNTLFERPAQPAEVAPLYVFLASGEASYVTGEVYGVTGGRTPY
jgi:hypothetical protein